MNCKEGNKRDPNPQPSMHLPNMWSLRKQLLAWKGPKDAHALNIFACTFDLSDCFTSLRLPPRAWGAFRVRGEGAGVYDLRLAGSCPLPCAKRWWATMSIRLLIL